MKAKKEIELFGKAVILEGVLRDKNPILHLPKSVEENNQELMEFRVMYVGDEVTRVEVGDVAICHVTPHMRIPHPLEKSVVVLTSETNISGRVC